MTGCAWCFTRSPVVGQLPVSPVFVRELPLTLERHIAESRCVFASGLRGRVAIGMSESNVPPVSRAHSLCADVMYNRRALRPVPGFRGLPDGMVPGSILTPAIWVATPPSTSDVGGNAEGHACGHARAPRHARAPSARRSSSSSRNANCSRTLCFAPAVVSSGEV